MLTLIAKIEKRNLTETENILIETALGDDYQIYFVVAENCCCSSPESGSSLMQDSHSAAA